MPMNQIISKIFMWLWGIALFILAIWFWFSYGSSRIFKLKIYGVSLPPPNTSMIIFAVVVVCVILVYCDKIRITIFGKDNDARTRILDMLGIIFAGFGLVVTILWSLLGNTYLPVHVIYIQSSLLVFLFGFIALSFYIMLSKVK
jgi:hypothetical protein